MATWQKVKIGQIADIAYGYTEKASFEEIGPKFLRITDIQDGDVNWDSVPYCRVSDKEHRSHRLISGDIVFARTGATTGKSYLITDPPDAVCASYLIRLRLTGGTALPEFVQLFFQSSAYWEAVEAGTSGSAQGGFNASKLADLGLVLPPLDEQRRIVAVLDKAFAGIATATANAQKNLTNARALFESYLASIFAKAARNSQLVPLSELATDITDGDHLPPPKAESGVPFITIGNIDKRSRKISFDRSFRVSPRYFNDLKANRKPRQGDVLYTVTGSFGIPVLVEDDIEFCFQRHIGLVRPKPTTDSQWLCYLLLSPQVFEQAEAGATGTAQKTVSLKVLRNIMVPKVDLADQRATVVELDALSIQADSLEATYQKSSPPSPNSNDPSCKRPSPGN